MQKEKDNFWGITTYYNPKNYKTKYRNFKKFRKNSQKQGLKLLVVECAFKDQSFVLTKKDADILIQVRSHSVLWQKERLLNIALEHLPKVCTKVAWLDCDILFLNNNWIDETSRLLDTYKVVQPYEFAVRLDKSNRCGDINRLPKGRGENVRYDGLVAKKAKNIKDEFFGHTGFAWSARRDVLEKIGFYDGFILGSGDRLMGESFFNKNASHNHDDHTILQGRTDWTNYVYACVKGSVYYTSGTILHLWHGNFKDRGHGERRAILKRFDFNEQEDLILNKDRCWEWNTNKTELIKAVENYFETRLEGEKFFSWKEYIHTRPNLRKNWNGPIRSYIHFLVFRRVDRARDLLRQKYWNYSHRKFLKKSMVSYKNSRMTLFNTLRRLLFLQKTSAKIFSFQKDEELLEEWILHHAKIFGMENIYIIDHDSGAETKKIYERYTPLGLQVFSFSGDFKEKHNCLSLIMSRHRRAADFLIPLDGDEFVFLKNKNKVSKNKRDILQYLHSSRGITGKFKMVSYANLLESFEPADVIAECGYFKKEGTNFLKKKTYYPAKYFINTDQGNHHGCVSRGDEIIYCSKLILLHYSHKSYSKFVEKLKRGVVAYGGKKGTSAGNNWFHKYSLYKKGELKKYFSEECFVGSVNKNSDDVICLAGDETHE